MPIFIYKAKKKTGEEYEGSFDAPDRFALFTHIREEGGEVISFTKKPGDKKFSVAKLNAFLSKVKEDDKINFARNTSAMLSAGLDLSRTLEVIERQTKAKILKNTVADIRKSVGKGESFAESLKKFPSIFSRLFIAMVRSGEESGNLAESLNVIASQMNQSHELKKKIRGAMMYPSIVIFAMVLVSIAMLIYVVPTLSSTFRELNVDLPASTRAIIAVSDFMRLNSILTLGIGLAAVAGIRFLLKTRSGKRTFELILLHTPIIGPLIKETNAARMSRTLSSLLSSGVPVVKALEITADVVQNSYFREVLTGAQKKIQKGTVLSEILRESENLYPPFVSEMTSVGEETGNLPKMLERVAIYYENEVSRKTKDMSTIIEPFLMIAIGAGVGFFAISMIQPIYSLSSAI